MLEHIRAGMNALEMICAQVFTQQKHQRWIVQELLQSLERKLVQVIEDLDYVQFALGVVFDQS